MVIEDGSLNFYPDCKILNIRNISFSQWYDVHDCKITHAYILEYMYVFWKGQMTVTCDQSYIPWKSSNI